MQRQVYLDGNFKLVHLSKAARTTAHQPAITDRILSDATVKQFCDQENTAIGSVEANACNDFNADSVLARKKQRYDLTGHHGLLLLP